MRLARLERDPKRLSRTEQVRLADHLVERARSHPLGERDRNGMGGRHGKAKDVRAGARRRPWAP